jgi:hypothetical protein
VIEDAVHQALTSEDPRAACQRFVTSRYVSVAYGSEQGCAQAVTSGAPASSVRAKSILADLNTGTAKWTGVASGGPNNGEKLEVTLVQEGGGWRVDSVESNVPVGP